MPDPKKLYLRPESINYIKQRLSGGHTLGKCLLDVQPLDHGSVFTFVPTGIEVNDEIVNSRLESGGLLPSPPSDTHMKVPGGIAVPIPHTSSLLRKIIRDFLVENPFHICVLEEPYSEISDRNPPFRELPYRFLDKQVYYFVTAAAETEIVDRVIIRCRSPYPGTIGAMTNLNGLKVNPIKGPISYAELKQLAQNAKHIIIGAYDAEGYLIWSSEKPHEEASSGQEK